VVTFGQPETLRPSIRVDGHLEFGAHGAADDPDAVPEVEEFAELGGDGVAGDDHRIREPVRPFRHRPVRGDAPAAEGFRVRPRDDVVDGHDDLVGFVVEAVVPAERAQEAR